MDRLKRASGEARQMYESLVEEAIPITTDIAEITRRVARSRDLDMFLCMGPHVKQILKRTRFVSASEFLLAFKRTVESLEESLGGSRWFAVTNHDGMLPENAFEGMEEHGLKVHDPRDKTQCNKKSGFFFLLLALSFSERLTNTLAGIICAPTQFEMDCSHVRSKVVMFDDMSYTGMQASTTLGQFHGADVYFASPFIGSAAWLELVQKRINVVYDQKVPMYAEMDVRESMSSRCLYKMNAYPTWFQHKIADNISSFPEIYKYTIEREIRPPYKNEALFPEYANLVESLSKNFVFDCNNV